VAPGKINGPGGTPPNVSSVEPGKPGGAASDVQKTDRGTGKEEAARAADRPSFSEKLAGPKAAGPAGAATPAGPSAAPGLTGDLAADLGAGKISPKAAIDRVIDRIVDRQVGPNAPASVRQTVRAALESAVADDPLLSEKIKTLGS